MLRAAYDSVRCVLCMCCCFVGRRCGSVAFRCHVTICAVFLRVFVLADFVATWVRRGCVILLLSLPFIAVLHWLQSTCVCVGGGTSSLASTARASGARSAAAATGTIEPAFVHLCARSRTPKDMVLAAAERRRHTRPHRAPASCDGRAQRLQRLEDVDVHRTRRSRIRARSLGRSLRREAHLLHAPKTPPCCAVQPGL